MAAFRDFKSVHLWHGGVFGVAIGLVQSCLVFLVVDIGDALEEQQREDVYLEVRSIDWAF